MIDPGRPFSQESYKYIIEALEDRLRNGVERARFTFERERSAYELAETVHAVTFVSGLKDGQPHVFQPGVDFQITDNLITWPDPGDTPDPGTQFEVRYVYRERPTGLTDFNPGSVVGTLVRAVAREMKLIYEQMDEAYRRAFIDQATGVALDNVVALLGVSRNEPLKATGEATFFLRRATNTAVPIPPGTRVADEFGRTFLTPVEDETPREIPPETEEFATASHNNVVRVTNRIAELIGVWPRGDAPDPATKLDTEPDFGEDERTVTFGDDVPPQGEVRVRYKPKSVTVPIKALRPGPEGNVNAGTITIMPTPPPDVDGVVNEEPTTGGQPPESDDQLRERAKHELEREGNATLDAIKFAVLDVDGVEGVEVIDHGVDSSVPLGEVRVRYSGGDDAQVERAIEEARAAGILARPAKIDTVMISGTFYLIPQPAVTTAAVESFRIAVVDAIRALAIGDPLSARRLNALAYNVPGLADVAEAHLYHDRRETPNQEVTDDPFVAEHTELLRPAVPDLEVALVGALRAEKPQRVDDHHEIELQLLDAGGVPAPKTRWRNFSLDVDGVLRARLKTAPEQPPERVGSFATPRTLSFVNEPTATLTITATDATGYDQDKHMSQVEVVINAAAYPGIMGTSATIDMPPEE